MWVDVGEHGKLFPVHFHVNHVFRYVSATTSNIDSARACEIPLTNGSQSAVERMPKNTPSCTQHEAMNVENKLVEIVCKE